MNTKFWDATAAGLVVIFAVYNIGHVYGLATDTGMAAAFAVCVAIVTDLMVISSVRLLILADGRNAPAWLLGAAALAVMLWASLRDAHDLSAILLRLFLPAAPGLMFWANHYRDVTEPASEAQPSVTATVTAIPTPASPPPVTPVTEPRVAAAAVTRRAVTEPVRPDDSSTETPAERQARQRAVLAALDLSLDDAPNAETARTVLAANPGAWSDNQRAAYTAIKREWDERKKKTPTPA